MQEEKQKAPFFTASRIAAIAVFSALSGILYVFGFSVPIAFAPWLELNFSDIPLLVGTFSLGTPSGMLIVVFRTLVKLIFKPTSTAFVGEIADILIGLALVVPAGVIYTKKRTLKGAIFSCVAGGVCSSAAAVLANRLLLIPFYVKAMGWDFAFLANMLTGLYPNCTADTFYNYYLWLSVLPFNLLRCLIASLLTFAVYKKVSFLIRKASEKFDGKKRGKAKENRKAQSGAEEQTAKNDSVEVKNRAEEEETGTIGTGKAKEEEKISGEK